eukprot:13354585-Alexandrium_andersonii.AAC.1
MRGSGRGWGLSELRTGCHACVTQLFVPCMPPLSTRAGLGAARAAINQFGSWSLAHAVFAAWSSHSPRRTPRGRH